MAADLSESGLAVVGEGNIVRIIQCRVGAGKYGKLIDSGGSWMRPKWIKRLTEWGSGGSQHHIGWLRIHHRVIRHIAKRIKDENSYL